ncbi:MAG TPA: hypothetical protein VK741_22805 [Acetobacteraceae bacterium]|jgi:hypothetical protein|nr:hypothetical protein [Acetobacteraceae bacterium]
MPIDVRKTIDNVGKIIGNVSALTRSDVLVGVPAAKTGRKQGEITNASLAYIHEFGSPMHNIPARPFLFPGVKRIRSQAIAMMKQGAKDALTGNLSSVDQVLNKVGILARNSVVNEITDPEPPFVPLKPATIRARLRKTQAGRRKLKQIKKRGVTVTQWAAETDAAGNPNIRPLIDSGQLRASVTYVIRRD